MKTNHFLLSGLGVIAVGGLVFTGCSKSDTTSPAASTTAPYSTDITPAEDDANASYAADDSKNIADASIQWQSSFVPRGQARRLMSLIYGSHITVTGKDTTVGGQADTVVYINFGKSDFFCRDNRNRRGTIIVYWGLQHSGETWLQAYFDSANTITMTFRNYYLKDNGIAGTRTWTNEGHNIGGFENWSFTADLTITYPNGQTATWNSTRNRALVEVDSTWYYEITGSANGVGRDSGTYSLTITSPLYITVMPWWAGGCPWPEAGSVTIDRISHNGSVTIIVDYGTLGTCEGDKYAIIGSNRYLFSMW